jgi:hypothetical protein
VVIDAVAAAGRQNDAVRSGEERWMTTEAVGQQLRYRVLTGPDDRAFCERISAALDDGYRLHGGPALTFDGERVIVAQALVRSDRPAVEPGSEVGS